MENVISTYVQYAPKLQAISPYGHRLVTQGQQKVW